MTGGTHVTEAECHRWRRSARDHHMSMPKIAESYDVDVHPATVGYHVKGECTHGDDVEPLASLPVSPKVQRDVGIHPPDDSDGDASDDRGRPEGGSKVTETQCHRWRHRFRTYDVDFPALAEQADDGITRHAVRYHVRGECSHTNIVAPQTSSGGGRSA